MARSRYIYIIEHAPSKDILKAFTVKHELISWVQQNLDEEYKSEIVISRHNDGFSSNNKITQFNWDTIRQ